MPEYNRSPFFAEENTVENSFRYLGKGVKLGDKGRIVCWYKLKGAKAYWAVYGDLSVKDVAPEDLPLPVEDGNTSAAKPANEVSPTSDQSATKEGAKTESKPAPVNGLSAEPNAEEAKAIADIEKVGGHFTVDEKSPGKPVKSVSLFGNKVTDAALEHLKGLPQLQRLDLLNTHVTDSGLFYLRGMTELREVNSS